MKTLITAAALALTAGMASAATSADFDRFGIDAGNLTQAQELQIKNAISSGDTHSEVQALVKAIAKNG